MDNSKEIEKAAKWLTDQNYSEKINHPDQGEIEPSFQWITVVRLLKEYAESQTAELRKENDDFKKSNHMMSKLIADHVDKGDEILKLLKEVEQWETAFDNMNQIHSGALEHQKELYEESYQRKCKEVEQLNSEFVIMGDLEKDARLLNEQKDKELKEIKEQRSEMVECFHEIYLKSNTAGYYLSKETRATILKWWKIK